MAGVEKSCNISNTGSFNLIKSIFDFRKPSLVVHFKQVELPSFGSCFFNQLVISTDKKICEFFNRTEFCRISKIFRRDRSAHLRILIVTAIAKGSYRYALALFFVVVLTF